MGVAVPLVVDGKVGYHAFGNKKLPAVVTDKVGVLSRRDFPWDGKHEPPGKLGVPLFFLRFGGVPQGIAVCKLWRRMGWEQDFFVGDFVLVGIVFLLLIIFREQLLAALVGSGGNSGFI